MRATLGSTLVLVMCLVGPTWFGSAPVPEAPRDLAGTCLVVPKAPGCVEYASHALQNLPSPMQLGFWRTACEVDASDRLAGGAACHRQTEGVEIRWRLHELRDLTPEDRIWLETMALERPWARLPLRPGGTTDLEVGAADGFDVVRLRSLQTELWEHALDEGDRAYARAVRVAQTGNALEPLLGWLAVVAAAVAMGAGAAWFWLSRGVTIVVNQHAITVAGHPVGWHDIERAVVHDRGLSLTLRSGRSIRTPAADLATSERATLSALIEARIAEEASGGSESTESRTELEDLVSHAPKG